MNEMPAGSTLRTGARLALDGTPSPALGSTFEADVGAARSPSPNVLVLGLGKNGLPASTRVYVVGADANEMVETSSSTGEDGQPRMRSNFFRRAR